MTFLSTRSPAEPVDADKALVSGTAPDGGLFIPERLPRLDRTHLQAAHTRLASLANALLTPFFESSRLSPDLSAICAETFSFPAPVVEPDAARPGLHALELFHGPTGAFKDFGARFLMTVLERLGDPAAPFSVLVATSGDTGGAVGSAAEGKAGVRAVILFPKGRVSAFQERQLTCWNAPVRALRVAGDFDACQHLVKEAFADPDLRRAMHLTSANSINLGRLLPQMVAIASAALQIEEKTGEKPGLVVPTGNLGHGVAALYARAMGVPVGPVVLATNANATLSDWFGTGRFEPRASIKTLANAMDVGAPSNFERLAALPEDAAQVRVSRVEDEAIRARIHADYTASGYVWCPHSACGAQAYAQLSEAERAERPWLVLACAHPFKFADVVEPIIGASLTPPEALAGVLDRETQATDIEADLASLADALDAHSEANQPHAA